VISCSICRIDSVIGGIGSIIGCIGCVIGCIGRVISGIGSVIGCIGLGDSGVIIYSSSGYGSGGVMISIGVSIRIGCGGLTLVIGEIVVSF